MYTRAHTLSHIQADCDNYLPQLNTFLLLFILEYAAQGCLFKELLDFKSESAILPGSLVTSSSGFLLVCFF